MKINKLVFFLLFSLSVIAFAGCNSAGTTGSGLSKEEALRVENEYIMKRLEIGNSILTAQKSFFDLMNSDASKVGKNDELLNSFKKDAAKIKEETQKLKNLKVPEIYKEPHEYEIQANAKFSEAVDYVLESLQTKDAVRINTLQSKVTKSIEESKDFRVKCDLAFYEIAQKRNKEIEEEINKNGLKDSK
ncbi:MAG: hypothetical protein N3B21_15145 [Clostridia bacterium]|nr:hypothetical protein [Clostridia bacterium]